MTDQCDEESASVNMQREIALALTIVLLICSCSVMMVAWYFHLNFKEWPMWKAILISWCFALGEYSTFHM